MRQHPVARWLLLAALFVFAATLTALLLSSVLRAAGYIGLLGVWACVVLTFAWLVAEYATRGWVRRHPLEDDAVLQPTDQGRTPR